MIILLRDLCQKARVLLSNLSERPVKSMAKHNHDKCKHVLVYCSDCDVVSCEKCSCEWGKKLTPTLSSAGSSTLTYPGSWIPNAIATNCGGVMPLSGDSAGGMGYQGQGGGGGK